MTAQTHRREKTSSTSRNDFLPPKLRDLFFRPGKHGEPIYIPSRYKIAHGGRGSGKSWGLAGLAVALGAESPLTILCVREYQTSIRDSIYQLICNRIEQMGLSNFYQIQATGIYGINGTKFIFAGIKTDPGKIKSMEGINICLVEEAEKVSETSWEMLIPTVRGKDNQDSEVWICFNPRDETDPTYQRYVVNLPLDARRVRLNWSDNPWFPTDLKIERLSDWKRANDAALNDDDRTQMLADYDHIWEGACQKNSNASVYRRRVIIEDFETPAGIRLYYGADWGFSVDPTALVRFFTTENADRSEELWIDYESFGWQCELDDTPKLFDKIPEARRWPIRADSARPETISYIARQGFNISAAEKWPGSVEDGIAHIKAYTKIHIHTRCKHLQEEARLYCYKVDRITNDVLPILVDAHNHGWDAVRYGLDGVIQRRGVPGQWARLGGTPPPAAVAPPKLPPKVVT